MGDFEGYRGIRPAGPRGAGCSEEKLTGMANPRNRWRALGEENWHQTLTPEPRQSVALIGDVHGCCEELVEMVAKLPEDCLTIVVGDLVNKGPDSLGCVRFARENGILLIKGNHEVAALTAYHARRQSKGRALADRPFWHWVDGLTEEEADWLHCCPFTYTLAGLNTIVVHAGLVPGRALKHQLPEDMVSMRRLGRARGEEWLPFEKDNVDGTSLWAQHWPGPEHVVFGHDAKAGLQQHPHATGLDTGCLYGRCLTSLVLPSQEMITVPARKTYVRPGSRPMPKAPPAAIPHVPSESVPRGHGAWKIGLVAATVAVAAAAVAAFRWAKHNGK